MEPVFLALFSTDFKLSYRHVDHTQIRKGFTWLSFAVATDDGGAFRRRRRLHARFFSSAWPVDLDVSPRASPERESYADRSYDVILQSLLDFADAAIVPCRPIPRRWADPGAIRLDDQCAGPGAVWL